MIKNITLSNAGSKPGWLLKPEPDHVVQFYKSESELLEALSEYIGAGLISGDSGMVIATRAHLEGLDERLIENGVDISSAYKTGQYTALDAAETLSKFMVNELPDRDKFFRFIGTRVEKLTERSKPIRAYGEMVALLWKTGNKDAVIMLENLWNELAERYSFSLFCGYPKLHFIMDGDARVEITECHSVSLHAQAA